MENLPQNQKSSWHTMISNLANNPLMPTRAQLTNLLSVVITLLIMSQLGPLLGPNAAIVATIVRQALPLALSYFVNMVADKAIDQPIDSRIADVSLGPVQPNTPISVNAK